MSRILEIIGYVISLVFVLGVGGWLFVRALKHSHNPAGQILKCVLSAGIVIGEVFFARHAKGSLVVGGGLIENAWSAIELVISIAIAGIILGIIWAPQISELLAKPLTSIIDGGNEPPEPKPLYSIAKTKRKLNHPLEAIFAIREQLAKFPNDYEGVMLLATIQAEDTRDLASAEMTLNHFCDQPNPPPRQFAAAMNHLADWHIKLARDFDSARVALEKIIARFPDTEMSLQAAQRIAHLGGTEKQMRASRHRQPFAVPEGIPSAGLRDSIQELVPAETDPAKLAAEYVEHLTQHPLDTEIREKLALIYANHYQRLDMATLELEELIQQPNQPSKRVAHWLNLLADLQIRLGANYETVRATLERIIERFPNLAAAEMARTRLGRLKLELKGRKETPGIKPGVREQNIGLV